MKKYAVNIILAVVILVLAVVLGYQFIGNKNKSNTNNATLTAQVETATPEPTTTPTEVPTPEPTQEPTSAPTEEPTPTPELTAEEGQQAQQKVEEQLGTQEERDANVKKFVADQLGISVEELEAMTAENNGINDTTAGNGGGGSTPIANPDTEQPYANEDNFVTPELPANQDNGNNSNNSDPWQGDGTFEFSESHGDGGPLTGDTVLNSN